MRTAPCSEQDPTSLTFMDLPEEIRNSFYELLLSHNRPLLLSRYTVKRDSSTPRKKTNRSRGCNGQLDYKFRCTTIALDKNRKIPASEAVVVPLLQTSKTINLEVSTVLLKENQFVFERPLILHEFYEALGAKAKWLAKVVVKDISGDLACEKICVLLRLEVPLSITIPAQRPQDHRDWLCPARDMGPHQTSYLALGKILAARHAFSPARF